MSLSEKALEVINNRESIPTFYSDLSIWTKSWIKNRSLPFTHSISDLFVFRKSVELVLNEGLETVFSRYTNVSNALITAIESIGLEMYPVSKKIVSPTVTAFKVPEGIDSEKLILHLWRKYGVLIANAWGPVLCGKVLRLGNMEYGANNHFATIALGALEKGLADLGYKIEIGTAVRTYLNEI